MPPSSRTTTDPACVADALAAGRRKPQTGRSDGPKPRLELIRAQGASDGHQRWRPNVGATTAD